MSNPMASSPSFEIRTADFQTYTFDAGIPAEFFAEHPGRLSICNFRSRHDGLHCLQWDWIAPGATLLYRHPDAFKHLTGRGEPRTPTWDLFNCISAFSLWVYNEKPIDDQIWLTIGHDDRVDVRFHMNLNFRGWRHLLAFYGRDMDGFPDQSTADTLKIISPRCAGRLFFDAFSPRTERDCRFSRPTPQTPWVNSAMHQLRKVPAPEPPISDFTDAHKLELDAISARFFSRYQLKAPPIPLQRLRESFKNWRITRTRDALGGNPIEPSSIRQFWKDAADMAIAFATDPSNEILSMVFDRVDFWLDQGYSDGPLPGQFLTGYEMRTHFGPVLLHLKDQLEHTGRFEPLLASIRLMVGTNELFDADPIANADVFNTELDARLFTILIRASDSQKWRELTMFQRWMETVAHQGELKPQGSFHHHEQEYVGYSFPALPPIASVINQLSRTCFAMPKMHQRIREIAAVIPFYTVNGYVPHTFAGRWREWKFEQYNIYRDLAEAGHPGAPDSFDDEMAGWYLYFAAADRKSELNDPIFAQYHSRGIPAAETPRGHLTMPYAVAALHRRDDWLVVFRGQRREFMGAEIYNYQLANSLGRYILYGSMQILHGRCTTPGQGGFRLDRGWNWNFWPGATTGELPFEALLCQFEVEEHYTDEAFAAGVALDGDGVFGMKLHEMEPCRTGPSARWLGFGEYRRRIAASLYDPSFRARKSVFCFGRNVIALGSGIENTDADHRTATTLFQNALPADRPSAVFPMEEFHSPAEATWTIDSQGNGYYVAPGNDPVVIYHRDQQSVVAVKSSDGTVALARAHGNMELAIIDHGRRPSAKGYEYCVIPDTNENEMSKFAKQMRDPATAAYRVLRRDNSAHIVEDRISGKIGMVIFETESPIDLGPIFAVDKPAIIMFGRRCDGTHRISVVDPDLGESTGGHYPHGFGPEFPFGTRLQLSLRGQWMLGSADHRVSLLRHDLLPDDGIVTVLELQCRDGAGFQFQVIEVAATRQRGVDGV